MFHDVCSHELNVGLLCVMSDLYASITTSAMLNCVVVK
jgi:hypothetical protein